MGNSDEFILFTATEDGADKYEIIHGCLSLFSRLLDGGNQVTEIRRLTNLGEDDKPFVPEEFRSLVFYQSEE